MPSQVLRWSGGWHSAGSAAPSVSGRGSSCLWSMHDLHPSFHDHGAPFLHGGWKGAPREVWGWSRELRVASAERQQGNLTVLQP